MENDEKRDVYESLKQSLIEMKEMRQGKREEKTWQDFREELKKEDEYMHVRNAERIEPFLQKLGKVWKYVPDLRFGQVFEALREHGGLRTDVFNVEDDDLEKVLDMLLEKIGTSKREISGAERKAIIENATKEAFEKYDDVFRKLSKN